MLYPDLRPFPVPGAMGVALLLTTAAAAFVAGMAFAQANDTPEAKTSDNEADDLNNLPTNN